MSLEEHDFAKFAWTQQEVLIAQCYHFCIIKGKMCENSFGILLSIEVIRAKTQHSSGGKHIFVLNRYGIANDEIMNYSQDWTLVYMDVEWTLSSKVSLVRRSRLPYVERFYTAKLLMFLVLKSSEDKQDSKSKTYLTQA